MDASPAVALCDGLELGLVLAVARFREHISVVAVAINVLVLWDQVHVKDADVDLQPRLTVPVEVIRLRLVCHRLYRVETLRVM